MKKLITLLLVLTGMVTTASATDLYVCVDNFDWWDGHVRIYASGGTAATKDFEASEKMYIGGRTWYKYTMTNSNTTAQIQYYYIDGSEHKQGEACSANIAVTTDCYVIPYNEKSGNNYLYRYFTAVEAPKCRNNIVGGFGDQTMTKVDDNTYKYELTKSQIGSNSDIWFRIWYWDTQLYRKNDADRLTVPSSTSNYNANASESAWAFGIPVPEYNFDKIVVTIQSSSSAAGYTISVDGYISKTLSKSYTYATLGSSAKLDLSGLSAEGVTAYRLTADYSAKTITKGDAFSGILAANKGVLLEYDLEANKTLQIPVSASDATSGDNQLVACTTGHVNQVDNDGKTRYILADQDGHVGFYMVNEAEGNDMGDYTAYLEVTNTDDATETGENAARLFFAFDDDPTGIEAVKTAQKMNGEYYNLAGQRVAQPTKGLYIVNGMKVIMK